MKTTKSVIAGLLLGTVLVSGNILSRLPAKNSTLATSASASTSATASVTVSNACSLSADTTSSGNSAHSATLSPRTYTTDIGQTTITISCNDINGWALYAIGNGEGTNKTDLVHSSNSSFIIPTGTATSGSLSNWSMKLSGTGTNQDASGPIISPYNSYAIIPSTNTKVASLDRNSVSSGGSSVMTTYAAYISSDQIAGTYSGKVKYTLVHPYTEVVCDDGYENINGVCTKIYYMQDVITWGDAVLPNSGDSIQATDRRDNKRYWVTRLADGNIWMTQNLDLDLSTSTALTSTDSDITSSWTPSTSTYTTGDNTWEFVDGPESYDPGNNYIPSGTGSATSTAGLASNSTELHYHQGNYYNWYAATAGSDAMDNGDEATQSICPKGWRLPYGTQANKSWYYLVNQASITSSNITTSPFYIPRAGGYNGSVGNVGSYGYYWSSTAGGNNYASYLRFNSSYVYSQDYFYAFCGYSVRCVARGLGISDIATMQQFGDLTSSQKASVLDSMTEGTQYQLKDSRDNKLYWVSKLADGNVWMTQNLDFVISTSGTTLTTSDSDVTSNKTLTATNGWTDADISFYEGGDNYLPNGTGSATSTSGLSSNSDNWHYHVGNYYNWPAATAGSGTSSVIDADATESICPKGWRLPTSNSYTNNYSFGKLTNAYGITNSTNGSSDANLLSSPLWFVRAGYVHYGSLYGQGSHGGVWSSRAYSSSYYAYLLNFHSSYVNPSYYLNRSGGFSVRCVTK